jgi:RimJ/RimL family protein N-acetyltransferase
MINLRFRKAQIEDIDIYFDWLNDETVRLNSFNSDVVNREQHEKWFFEKLNDIKYTFYIFQNIENINVGQVRINELDEINAIIGLSISPLHRGFGYGSLMLKMACENYFIHHPNHTINAYIKIENVASRKTFENAGFKYINKDFFNNQMSYHFINYANR